MGDKSAFVGGMKLKISELGKVITGNTPSKKIKEFWDKDDVGFVKPDIISDEHIVKIKSEDCNEFISNAAISKARIVPKNSIFVTCIGNIGKIGVATENLAFNQQINAIIPNENVNLDYLCYAIFANKTRLQDIANAPIVPLLNKSQFSEFELEFDMDINTQTRIVHELNTVSNIILKYKQELLLLDELVRARFVEMFGNPENNLYNFSKMKLGKICDVRDGTHDSPKYQTVGYPLITSKNLTSGEIDFSNCNYIKEEDYKKINLRSEVTRGDIIMPMIGTIGNPIIVNTDIRFAIKNVALIKFNNNTLQNIYVKYFLGSDYFDFSVLRNIRGGTQKFIALKDLRDLDILVPPLELQNQFASFVKEIDKSRSRIQKSLEASQELFDSLMQEYFG